MFNVGDKVRRVEPSQWEGFGDVGEEYTVLDLTPTGALVIFEGCSGASQFAFELVEPLPVAEQPAAWVPAVGEKIVWLETFKSEFYTKGKTYEIVDKNDYGTFYLNDDRGDVRHSWGCESIVNSFKPFAIEAGRYYKTRDGRKVGPMAQFYDDGKCFKSKDTMKGGLWHSDGSAWFNGVEDSPTLVAEWIDEPLAATASNDNAAPAKFKVGDVVVATRDYAEVTKGRHYTIIEVDSDDEDLPIRVTDDAGDGWWLDDGTFELVSPTVAPQQSASTAGFTIPLVDDEPANDNTLTVTLSLDAADLHDELDEIIAKLKKIRKLQRQTGLAA